MFYLYITGNRIDVNFMIALLWIAVARCQLSNITSIGTNTPNVLSSNAPFLECLSKTGARFLSPSSSNYSTFTTGFNYRFHNTPVAIIYPTSDILVQQAVRCAVANRIMITPRCGGHSHQVLYMKLNIGIFFWKRCLSYRFKWNERISHQYC
jgi:hypothetical protein